MYNPKIERCATVLQKRSKITIVMRKRQPADYNIHESKIILVLQYDYYVFLEIPVQLKFLKMCVLVLNCYVGLKIYLKWLYILRNE